MRPGPVRVAICGGGVIGAAIAYFLSTRGVRALVIERAGIGNAASGKSGGFLALDWCRGTPVDPLARRSFELHAQLAERLGEELGLEWSYRRLDTLSVVVSQARDLGALEGDSAPGGGPNPGTAPGPDWLAAETVVQGRIGTEATTAQLHPALFTQGLMAAAEAGGAEVVKGGLRVSYWARVAAGRPESSSTERRSRRTPWWSRWGPGRSWPANGCRCPPSTA